MRNADNMGYANSTGGLFGLEREFMLATEVQGALIDIGEFSLEIPLVYSSNRSSPWSVTS